MTSYNSLRAQVLNDNSYQLIDPISMDIFTDPVIAADGNTYERASILAWFQRKKDDRQPITSPLTNLPLANENLIPNIELATELLHYTASKSTIQVSDIKFTLTSHIFQDLDKIADLPQMKFLELQPPKIVVIGNESHGKSTILERIIGLPLFPKEKGLCTRCVIRVHLRRCTRKEPSIAEISIKQLQRQSVVIAALDNIRAKIQDAMNLLISNDEQNRLIIDDHEIVVKIHLPYCLNLDILDVPGLVTTSRTGCSQNLPEVTENLAMKIINEEQESSIFLLVNDVRVPPNQSRGCAVIEQCKVQERTLGIFTKLDTFASDDGDEVTELEQLLTNRASNSFPVGYGWMAGVSKKTTILPGSRSPELQILQSMDVIERNLLESKFARLNVLTILGINNIRQKVQELYEIFIQNNWVPIILRRLTDHLSSLKESMNELGMPLPSDPDYFNPRNNCADHVLFKFFNSQYLLKLIRKLFISIAEDAESVWLHSSADKTLWELIEKYKNVIGARNKNNAYHRPESSGYGGMMYANMPRFKKEFVKLSEVQNNAHHHTGSSEYGGMVYANMPRFKKEFVKPSEVQNNAYHHTGSSEYGGMVYANMTEFKKVIKPSEVHKIRIEMEVNVQSLLYELHERLRAKVTTNISLIVTEMHERSKTFKLSRFPRLETTIRAIIQKKLTDIVTLFDSWFNTFMTTCFSSSLVITEYFNNEKANEVNCGLNWSQPELLNQYPHKMIDKWYEFIFQEFPNVANDITNEDVEGLTETCKYERLNLFQRINDVVEVQIAVEKFSKRLNYDKV